MSKGPKPAPGVKADRMSNEVDRRHVKKSEACPWGESRPDANPEVMLLYNNVARLRQ
jgi:hypothetical protein